MARYIFVVGGVMSSIGKGVTIASIGKILQNKGFKVTAVKIDPYINLDASTMDSIEHGEFFVTKDGLGCDQDIGNYERFLEEDLTRDNYLTTGQIYETVIRKERNLEYGGKCVEVVPHIPNEVIAKIRNAGKIAQADFVLIEIGGTVGEYQNMLFLEAARMLHLEEPKKVLFVLVSYLPMPPKIGEMKTKPTQMASRLLNEAGIQAHIIIGRSEQPLDQIRKKKISTFCNIQEKDVISAPDIDFIYEIPLNFEKDNLGNIILKKFGLKARKNGLKDWEKLVKVIKNAKKKVKIGVLGKYIEAGNFVLADSYLSLIESLKHASWFHKVNPEIVWLSGQTYEKNKNKLKELKKLDGVVVPGDLNKKGVKGRIMVIKYCRQNKIPYLGLSFGQQLTLAEFAQNVSKTKGINLNNNSSKSKNLSREEKCNGKILLGEYPCFIKKGTKAYSFYKKAKWGKEIKGGIIAQERHRYSYQINDQVRQQLEDKGLIISGVNQEKNLIEIVEIKNHPFFIGSQFYPEFKSRPLNPHPIFREFIRATIRH